MAESRQLFDDLLDAFEDYFEAKRELAERKTEYTGYSPSYALASWVEVADKARERAREALDKYVLEVRP